MTRVIINAPVGRFAKVMCSSDSEGITYNAELNTADLPKAAASTAYSMNADYIILCGAPANYLNKIKDDIAEYNMHTYNRGIEIKIQENTI